MCVCVECVCVWVACVTRPSGKYTGMAAKKNAQQPSKARKDAIDDDDDAAAKRTKRAPKE